MKSPTPVVCNTASRSTLSVREMTLLALFAALMIAVQVALASLPNLELVTLLIILVTVHLGWKAMFSVAVFVLVEGLIYGFNMWFINYLYVWPILTMLVMALRSQSSVLLWTIVAGIYGLLFGTLCSIPYFLAGGWAAGVSYIVAGLTFDLTHCAGNVVSVLILFSPLNKILQRFLR